MSKAPLPRSRKGRWLSACKIVRDEAYGRGLMDGANRIILELGKPAGIKMADGRTARLAYDPPEAVE